MASTHSSIYTERGEFPNLQRGFSCWVAKHAAECCSMLHHVSHIAGFLSFKTSGPVRKRIIFFPLQQTHFLNHSLLWPHHIHRVGILFMCSTYTYRDLNPPSFFIGKLNLSLWATECSPYLEVSDCWLWQHWIKSFHRPNLISPNSEHIALCWWEVAWRDSICYLGR